MLSRNIHYKDVINSISDKDIEGLTSLSWVARGGLFLYRENYDI
jgi:hypothetical protein